MAEGFSWSWKVKNKKQHRMKEKITVHFVKNFFLKFFVIAKLGQDPGTAYTFQLTYLTE
jgi:hypothetical protein